MEIQCFEKKANLKRFDILNVLKVSYVGISIFCAESIAGQLIGHCDLAIDHLFQKRETLHNSPARNAALEFPNVEKLFVWSFIHEFGVKVFLSS